jgi:hypothetical protein
LTTTALRPRLATACARISYQIWFPLAVYVVTRLIDAVLIVIAARHQIALPRGAPGLAGYNIWASSPASPGYSSVASNWDGQWYFSIASHGYPATLPRNAAGHVVPNQWAFYPAFPLLAGAIMRLSGLGFTVVAPILNVLLGGAAVTVMFRLINQRSGRFAASATVLLTCTYMAAPVMQIAYTESMALLLVCTALLLLRNRRYGWLIPVLVMLALTRGVALAFAPVVVVHGISRYRRRLVEPFSVLDRWRVLGLACLTVALTGLWPAIAGIITRDPQAYIKTMSSYDTKGRLHVLIAYPAFVWAQGGAVGLAILLGTIALIAVIVLRSGARAWGPEVRAWAGFYPLYLLLATSPLTDAVRHLLLAFPLLWPFPEMAATTRDRRQRVAVVAILAICGLVTQWVWISQFLVLAGPPQGRPFP